MNFRKSSGLIRRIPGNEGIQERSERIKIGFWRQRSRLRLFRSHVFNRSYYHIGGRQSGITEEMRNSVIRNLDLAIRKQKNIRRFNIPMNDSAVMRMFKRLTDLYSNMDNFFPRKKPLLFEKMLETRTIHKLHGVILKSVFFSKTVKTDNVRMSKPL